MKGCSIKRLFLPLSAALLTLQACDPLFDEYCIIHNNTSQTVTIIPSGHHYIRQNDEPYALDTFDFPPATIAADADSMVMYNGGVGSSDQEQAFRQLCTYLGDSVVFCFEDGRRTVYYKTDTLGISPYNPIAPCYHWEEKVGKPYAGHVYFGSLTFTVGNEHYQEASK